MACRTAPPAGVVVGARRKGGDVATRKTKRAWLLEDSAGRSPRRSPRIRKATGAILGRKTHLVWANRWGGGEKSAYVRQAGSELTAGALEAQRSRSHGADLLCECSF